MDPKTTTLEKAKQWLRAHFVDGTDCPCCGQFVKQYQRKLDSFMAYALILIYKHFAKEGADEWLHVPSYLVETGAGPQAGGGASAKLRYWGLIEDKPATRPDGGKHTGFYRITEKGRLFVENKAKVRKYIYLFNQKPVRVDQPDLTEITILEDRKSVV